MWSGYLSTYIRIKSCLFYYNPIFLFNCLPYVCLPLRSPISMAIFFLSPLTNVYSSHFCSSWIFHSSISCESYVSQHTPLAWHMIAFEFSVRPFFLMFMFCDPYSALPPWPLISVNPPSPSIASSNNPCYLHLGGMFIIISWNHRKISPCIG